MSISKRQAKNIFFVLEPCLKKDRKKRYATLYGSKTKEGLIETIINAGMAKGEFLEKGGE